METPQKTQEVFVDCPFIEGERMYRIGDLGYYDENDDLEILGRIDFQVKLRGFRIEIGEVESRALQYEGINQAAAAVKSENLLLYFTAKRKSTRKICRNS